MTTISDREASAGFQSARPFTCSWPKGCPKVNLSFPSPSPILGTGNPIWDTRFADPAIELQSEIGFATTLQNTYQRETVFLSSHRLREELYSKERIDSPHPHAHGRKTS